MSTKTIEKMPIFLAAILSIFVIGLIQQSKLKNIEQAQTLSVTERQDIKAEIKVQETASSLQLNLLKQLPSFGFKNLIADWTFLRFLQYFGHEELRDISGYSLSPFFFEIIVGKDPLFFVPYIYLTNSVSMYAAQPETAVSLMERGLKYMTPQTPSRSYYVWRYKGTDELLFLGNSEEARNSFLMASQWAYLSDDSESQTVASASQKTAEFLHRNPGSKAAQISAWANVLVRAVDEETRKLAVRNIEDLGGTILVSNSGQVSVRYQNSED